LGKVTCVQTSGTLGCTCDNANGYCPTLGTTNTAGFDAIVTRMQAMYPRVNASRVIVEYRGSGVGYAGDPGGMDVSPLVTVKLQNVPFNPLVFFGLVNFNLPSFATSLTAEDSSNIYSN
jgi:hypothetical protein